MQLGPLRPVKQAWSIGRGSWAMPFVRRTASCHLLDGHVGERPCGAGLPMRYGITCLLLIASAWAPGLLAQSPPPTAALAPAQAARLRSIVDQAHRRRQRLLHQLGAERRQLARLFDRYQLDEPRIDALIWQIHATQCQLLSLHLQTQRKLRQIATPDQFAVIVQAMRPMPWHRNTKPSMARMP